MQTTSVYAYTGSGVGTLGDPYVITSCAEFMEIDDDPYDYYVLSNSIDCSSDENSIITVSTFGGGLDGGNNTVTVDINRVGSTRTGLFERINGADIRDLTVTGTVVSDNGGTGLLAGAIDGSTIDNVHTAGTVTAAANNVGGFSGSVSCGSAITNSSSSASVTGYDRVGGFTGVDGCEGPGSSFTGSFATGNVTGTVNVGGFLGLGSTTHLEDVYATGAVSGIVSTGGLVGSYSSYDEDFMIFHSYATGDVTAMGGEGAGANFGGLVGYLDGGILSQSYATGDVLGAGRSVGGLVGYSPSSDGFIYNSYARGNVAGFIYVGGFVGRNIDTKVIINSYSTGAVVSAGEAGDFAGYSESAIYNSFLNSDVSSNDACGPTAGICEVEARTSTQLKNQTTFTEVEWNFSTVWGIDAGTNDGYPHHIGGAHEEPLRPMKQGPVETILGENQFHGGGVGQGWNGDDDYWGYELPFTFTFYGQDYTEVFIDSNGYLSFSDSDGMGDYEFDLEEGIGVPIIMALSGDLDGDCSSGEGHPDQDIYITDADDGTVIFRWATAEHDSCEIIMNFEIVLHEDNTFEINYGEFIGLDEVVYEDDEVGLRGDAGVHDGFYSFVHSEYSQKTDISNVNTSAWQVVEVVETVTEDSDGVSTEVEDAAPNGGDANNDGIKDSEQERVTSAVNPITGEYVVLESSGVCSANNSVLVEVETTVESDNDDNYDYPAGLLDFTLSGCGVGETETITQYYFGDFDIGSLVLRKYNKSTSTYADVADAELTAVTIGDKAAIKVVYTVTDGGELDADGEANGVIVDPVGLGTLVISSPNTGFERVNYYAPIVTLIVGAAIITSTSKYAYSKKSN